MIADKGKFRHCLPLLLLVTLPTVVQGQFTYFTNNWDIIITGYSGPGGAVAIPGTIDGLPVTSIGNGAFAGLINLTSIAIPTNVTSIGTNAFNSCYNMTNVAIPNGVTNIENGAFGLCSRLTSVNIPNSVISMGNGIFHDCTSLTNITISDSVSNIGDDAFYNCPNLASVMIPSSVSNIGKRAFYGCERLTRVTIPKAVINIGDWAFGFCISLTEIYFQGNVPIVGTNVFDAFNNLTIYYLSGATGWSSYFGGVSTVLWNPQTQTSDASFGVRTNQFGFTITGSSNLVIVVEACTNLTHPTWSPLQTNTLTGGAAYFSDPQWTNQPARFYRLRSP